MADKNVNTVTSATAIASGDSLIVSKSNTTLQKIDYNLLAKAIIEQYTGSSLAGQNQTLAAAISALNSNIYGDVLPTDTDINSVITAGTYACYGNNNYTNLPSGQTYGTLQVIKHSKITGWITQIFYVGNTNEYKRNTTTAGTSWGAWTLVPTRAEMDALNSNEDLTNQITVSDGIELRSGGLRRYGRLYILNAVFYSNTEFLSNGVQTTIASMPADITPSTTNTAINGYCAVSETEWTISDISYFYVSTNIVVKPNVANMHYAKVCAIWLR